MKAKISLRKNSNGEERVALRIIKLQNEEFKKKYPSRLDFSVDCSSD